MAAGSAVAPPPPSAPPERARGLAAEPDSGLRSATNDAFLFTGANYVAQGFLFVAGLLQRGLLGPTGAGYWALMQSAWTYLTIAPLGTMNATGRQIPFYRGKKDIDAAVAVSDTGSSFSILAVGVVGAFMTAVCLLFGGGWPDELRYGLALLGVLGPLRMFGDVHKTLLQATKRFDASSVTTVVEAMILVVVQTLCVVAFGFYGMFLGIALSIVGLYLLWIRMGVAGFRRAAFGWTIERRRVPELVSFGLPLMIQGQLWLLFMSIDNLIVAGFISVKQLGYYALAVAVTNYVLHLPRSIGAALFPRMTEKFVETETIESIRHYATDTQRLLAYMLVPVFLGAAYFLVPVLIRQGLPAFTPAIEVVRIMVAGSFFIALVNMPTKVLTTAGYRWGITALTVMCLAVNAAANFVAVAVLDWGLEGAAAATAFSYLVAFLVLTTYALIKVLTVRDAFVHIGELLIVVTYTLGALWGIEGLLGSGAGPLVSDAALGLVKLALFLVAITPWLWLAERRYRGLTRLLGVARSGAARLRRR
jgi:O-antigen/teichoic acid export membrane protein